MLEMLLPFLMCVFKFNSRRDAHAKRLAFAFKLFKLFDCLSEQVEVVSCFLFAEDMPLGRPPQYTGVEHARDHLPGRVRRQLRLGHAPFEFLQPQLRLSQRGVLLDDGLADKVADHDDPFEKPKLGVGRDGVVLRVDAPVSLNAAILSKAPSSDPGRRLCAGPRTTCC